MESLPVDLFIQQITYLPFDDVTNLCQINKQFQEYCTNSKYGNNWRLLIKNTFSGLDDYETNLEDLLKKYGGYNYHVYTNFVKNLDPVTQAMIYYKQKDMKSFEALSRRQKFLAMFLLGNKQEARKYLIQGYSFYFELLDGHNIATQARNDILKTMISENSLTGVKYLLKKGAIADGFIFSQIIKEDRLRILKYLIESGVDFDKNFLIQLANIYGKRDIVKYLESL